MNDRPIMFSGAMVRAILDGRKTQTRRIVKHGTGWVSGLDGYTYQGCTTNPGHHIMQCGAAEERIECPYGQPGDRLWVREAWASLGDSSTITPPVPRQCQVRYSADGHAEWRTVPDGAKGVFPASLKGRPSIHMPRWASRITLEITDVRIERLNDISESDALAEGVDVKMDAVMIAAKCRGQAGTAAQLEYWHLWESIHGKGSWAVNPFVWVVEFKKL